MTAPELRFAALTEVGRQREHNEDNFLVDRKLGFFVVCDGMGGHAAGEVASAIAVRTVHEEVKQQLELLRTYVAGSAARSPVGKRELIHMLERAVNRASHRVHEESVKDPSKRGMGTTLVATLLVGHEAFMIYVGDSRIYMLRDGVLQQLTSDHTVFNELLRRKKLPREQIEKVSQKNAITRAVGVYEHAEPDSLVIDIVAGDRFLLCSDGLHGYFEDDSEALGRCLIGDDLDKAVATLVDSANSKGGKDNITAVLVAIGEVAERDEVRARKLQLQREMLERMPLFRSLNDREILRVLQVTTLVVYKAGSVVMTQGQQGEELFIVLRGSARASLGATVLGQFAPGDHFGEMALVRNEARSATVTCTSDSELIQLRRPEFFELLREEPQLSVKLLWRFLGVLADRLADRNRELGAAREELRAEDITAEVFDDDEDDEENRRTLLPELASKVDPGTPA